MMYKKGQLVLFRSDLEIGVDYGGITFIEGMDNLKGTLCSICEYDESDNTFTINEDGQKYWFSEEMLVF